MSVYSYDLEHMADAESAMRKFHTSATESLREVENLIDTVRSVWDSPAAAQYEESHRRWVKSAADMNTSMNEMRSWMESVRTSYDAVMRSNTRMFPN